MQLYHIAHTTLFHPFSANDFLHARDATVAPKFMVYINRHTVRFREKAFDAISEIGASVARGSCHGSHPELSEWAHDGSQRLTKNHAIMESFRFALVMENSNVKGYITEKIANAFIASTIPIYYGTTEIFKLFNKEAFIYYDIHNPRPSLDRIRYLENNRTAYSEMLARPVLAGPHVLEKYFSLTDDVGGGALKQRIRDLVLGVVTTPASWMFVKIPKVGGTTVVDALMRAAKLSHRTIWTAHVTSTPGLWWQHATYRQIARRAVSPAFYITWLRRPSERCMSNYYFSRISRGHNTPNVSDKLKFIRDCFSYSRHWINSVDHYGHIGITERMDDSLVLLSIKLNIPVTHLLYRTIKNSHDPNRLKIHPLDKASVDAPHPPLQDESPRVVAAARELDSCDQNLDMCDYETALRRLDDELRTHGDEVTKRLRTFRAIQRIIANTCDAKQARNCFRVDKGCFEDCKDRAMVLGSIPIVHGSGMYNLDNPTGKRAGTYHWSQFHQDVVVDALLKQKRNGFFVEIGGYDGELHSNTLFFERQRGWDGLLVEANPFTYEQMITRDRACGMVHACISRTLPLMHFKIGGGLTSALETASNSQLSRITRDARLYDKKSQWKGYGQTVTTTCTTLNAILASIGIHHVHYFSLDVEGAEMHVLESIDFSRLTFDVLTIEVDHHKHKIRSFMKARGYHHVTSADTSDDVFIHPRLL
jgi:hypothetical protein